MLKVFLSILALAGVCHSVVVDVPSVYGPIPHVGDFSGVDSTKYLKKSPGDFVHPGIWHTHEDLERILDVIYGMFSCVYTQAELRQAMLDWYVPRQGPEFESWLDALDAVAARIERYMQCCAARSEPGGRTNGALLRQAVKSSRGEVVVMRE